MNFSFENLIAFNFTNLNEKQKLEILEMRNNKNIRKFMSINREITKEEHFKFIENLKRDKNKAYFAIQEQSIQNKNLKNKEDCFIGVVCFNNIDFYNKNAIFGIYSNPNEKNGDKLMNILKYIAFKELNLHILFAKVLSTNKRALRFYQKHSFMQYGIFPEAIKRNKVFIDIIILALRK
ncbi:UDP-4-amino-4,6-dideoxy-N-acetyl-beta-L-altrosamine N-acetyltransferase [Helicobacter sp. MIT 14-3879]|uniref:UDP-4-amino-4, 6-dideoxy-N-acetyl-beta-L-altrosamine N-acetyltransferase n=1 Tax=Helicobacter sp. MIT 14-3879 TaxID=2040649 RepID=UPI000E1F7A5E|nr:UDP-4-amino-4,6-dideoxy-N-acetyl-beta-L-altrosamine N-acetyltransferase [Helicobacter sp. MIT 14-3879]RDU62252.1 UDP-4-amino-4,6-dideoxy-N-acetyl-beta-L-altrosamine N-acetyltransferase [Helicobacter sp. MIT 14-3879]